MQAFGQEYEPVGLNGPRPQTRQMRTSTLTCSQDWQVIKRACLLPFSSTADTEFIDSVLEATINSTLAEHYHDDPERNTSLVSGWCFPNINYTSTLNPATNSRIAHHSPSIRPEAEAVELKEDEKDEEYRREDDDEADEADEADEEGEEDTIANDMLWAPHVKYPNKRKKSSKSINPQAVKRCKQRSSTANAK
jgi:hypothetical protein